VPISPDDYRYISTVYRFGLTVLSGSVLIAPPKAVVLAG
jgi:hypothetical protein